MRKFLFFLFFFVFSFLFFKVSFADSLVFSQTESAGWSFSDNYICNTFYLPNDTLFTRGFFLVRNIGNNNSMIQFRIDGPWDNKFYAYTFLPSGFQGYLELQNDAPNPTTTSAGFHQFCYTAQYYYPTYGGQVSVNNAGFPTIFLYGTTLDYVNFLYPQNNNTYNQQQLNNFWTVNFKFTTSTDFELRAFVRWCNINSPVGCDENNLYIIDDKFLGSSLDFSDQEWSTSIPFQGTFYNGTYKAQACLTKENYLLSPFLCSDVITFYIQDINFFNLSTSTPSQINLEGVCTPPQGGFLDYPVDNIGYAICRVFAFLFIPSEAQKNNLFSNLDSLKNSIKTAFPFRYYFDIFDSFKNSLSSASSSNYEFKLNFFNKDFLVFSSSTISNVLGSENYNLLRQYSGYALYIMSVILILSIL